MRLTVPLLWANAPESAQLPPTFIVPEGAVKVVLAVRAPDETFVPDVPVCQAAPAFVIEQDVALVEDHVMFDDWPDVMDVGFAERVAVGAGV